MFEITKFPEIIYKDRTLVWDSRQPQYPKEMVFVSGRGSSLEVQEALLSRKNAIFVREPGLGGDVESQNVLWELGKTAAEACGEPSKKIKIIAVTGTNGKTTTASLIRHLLVSLGKNVLEIGTIGCRHYLAGNPNQPIQDMDLGYTTPMAPQIHELLRQALGNNIDYVVMEASSQGIELGRMAGLHLSGAIFLNLTQDHLDFHKTMEAYGEAKLKLFSDLLNPSKQIFKWAIINQEQHLSSKILNVLDPSIAREILRKDTDYSYQSLGLSGMKVQLRDQFVLESTLMGAHNAQNIVSGVLATRLCGFEMPSIQMALKTFPGAKGRLERVSEMQSLCHVFVDYAHSPDALEKILLSVRQAEPDKQLICVFGCGGDRDKTKRPMMGKIAAELSDLAVVTADNSRSEDTLDIIEDIVGPLNSDLRSKIQSEPDRRKAIELAIQLGAQKNAVVIIAGKGHEEYQILKGLKSHFSDQETAKEALLALK